MMEWHRMDGMQWTSMGWDGWDGWRMGSAWSGYIASSFSRFRSECFKRMPWQLIPILKPLWSLISVQLAPSVTRPGVWRLRFNPAQQQYPAPFLSVRLVDRVNGPRALRMIEDPSCGKRRAHHVTLMSGCSISHTTSLSLCLSLFLTRHLSLSFSFSFLQQPPGHSSSSRSTRRPPSHLQIGLEVARLLVDELVDFAVRGGWDAFLGGEGVDFLINHRILPTA